MKAFKTRIVCLLLTLTLVGQLVGGLAVSAAGTNGAAPSIPKVLLIGNSYSVDVMRYYLHKILQKEGVKDFTIGFLYYPGCTVKMHLDFAKKGQTVYDYYKCTASMTDWKRTPEATLLTGLQDEPWDEIYFQQGPIEAAQPEKYGSYLEDLRTYVNANKTNPKAKLGFHMTWAYAARYATRGEYHSEDFVKQFNGDSDTMYNAISATVQKVIEKSKFTAGIVPAGTAVQNVRSSYIGDTLDADGYHLNNLGRAISAYTWYAYLSGKTIEEVSLEMPELNLTATDREVIKEAVNNAIAHPYEITPSKYPRTYGVTVTGGAAEVGGQQATAAAAGEQVTISFTLPDEMQFTEWKVVRGAVTLADPTNAKTTFTMPGEEVEIQATYVDNCPSKNYVDVSPFQWYHEAVDYVVSHGIMGGYDARTFGPGDNLSRAMIVQILYNYEQKPEVTAENRFPDVSASAWYYNAVRWGANKGVVSGYGSGKFGPDDDVTLEQVAVILWNYAGKPEAESNLESVGTYNDWAAEALSWCEATGILKNVPITRAIDTASRAQTAQMLVNYLNLKA